MDEYRYWHTLRCATPHDLPSQGYPAEPTLLDGRTCAARDLRRVCFDSDIFLSPAERLHDLCSENRATGVVYAPNPLFHPNGPKETCAVRVTAACRSEGACCTDSLILKFGARRKVVVPVDKLVGKGQSAKAGHEAASAVRMKASIGTM